VNPSQNVDSSEQSETSKFTLHKPTIMSLEKQSWWNENGWFTKENLEHLLHGGVSAHRRLCLRPGGQVFAEAHRARLRQTTAEFYGPCPEEKSKQTSRAARRLVPGWFSEGRRIRPIASPRLAKQILAYVGDDLERLSDDISHFFDQTRGVDTMATDSWTAWNYACTFGAELRKQNEEHAAYMITKRAALGDAFVASMPEFALELAAAQAAVQAPAQAARGSAPALRRVSERLAGSKRGRKVWADEEEDADTDEGDNTDESDMGEPAWRREEEEEEEVLEDPTLEPTLEPTQKPTEELAVPCAVARQHAVVDLTLEDN
jgi:hypothetical protein